MFLLVVTMVVVLVLAGLVVVYVAFPHRGEDVPHVPWLGRVLRKGVETAPTLDNTAEPVPTDPEPHSLSLDLTHADHRRSEGRRRA